MKKPITLILFALFLSNVLLGCTFFSNSFCVSTNQLSGHSIISGTIISVDEDGIDFEVMDVLRGDETNEVIRIWDGEDFDCNGPWSMAASDLGEVGTSKVLILPQMTTGDYSRPNWYEYTTDLEIVDGIVEGWIRGFTFWAGPNDPFPTESDNYIKEITYDAFATSFGTTLDCSLMVDVEEEITTSLQTTITNPFHSDLNITIDNENFDGNISVFDMNGIAIRQLKVQSQNQVSIDLSFVPSGIYFVRFENDDKQSMVRKVVKQ